MQQNMRPITKPDLNSIFESMLPLAKSNPQYINAYLLTGTPEQKLAAAMIKDMPKSQAPAAPVQAPTQTVIEQKAAQVDPGIASLPMAEDMYDEQSMAAGGIVAFDDGGTIAYNRALQNSFLGPDALGMAGTLVDRYAPNVKNLVKEAGGFLVDKISGMRWVRNPYTGELQRASEVVENPNSGKFANLGPMGDSLAPPAEGLASIPTPFSALPAAQQKVNLGNTAAQPVTEARPDAAPKAAPATDPRLATGRDLGYALPDIKVTKLTEPAGLSTLDALNQHKQALEEAGIDPDYYSKQAEKLTEVYYLNL